MVTKHGRNHRRATKVVAVLATVAITSFAGISNSQATVKFKGTIVMGVLAPFTGTNAQSATSLMKGVNLAVNEINAAGGINGKKLKVVTGDTVSDPTDAASAASKMINVDKAQFIIGPRTITAPVVLPMTQRAKIPEFIVGGNTILDQNSDPYFFRTTPSDSQQAIAMAAYAIKKGYKTAALAFEQQPAAQTLKDPIIKAFESHGGKVLTVVDITPAQSSYRSEIQKLYAPKPDVIFTQVSSQTSSVFFPEVQQLEPNSPTPYIGSNTFDASDWFQAVGAPIANGPIYATQSSSEGGAAYQHYLSEYKKAYKTDQIANLSQGMYDGVMLGALAIQASGATTGLKMAQAVMKISNPPGTLCATFATCVKLLKAKKKINYDGAGGTVDFDKYHNVFGPFQALHFDASGNIQVVATISSTTLRLW